MYTERYTLIAREASVMNNWIKDSIFYHIYPLGLCGAPEYNIYGAPQENRLELLHGWLPHIKGMGANAVYLGPVFESCGHGYDTIDYCSVDRRLGTNDTLRELIKAFHANGQRVILDGVFNHVGREFLAFKDVKNLRERSSGVNWFKSINFSGNNAYNDGLSYRCWNDCQDLVDLNLVNPEVCAYLLGCVKKWIEEFDIDGLRLDAADCLDLRFLESLRKGTDVFRKNFWLMGEVLHSAEYDKRTAPGLLDSVTNYEVYKGLHSSHNDKNYFELAYSLDRFFGKNGLLRDKTLYNFADNHDVERIMSVLKNKEHIYPLYILLFSIPGVPSVYYGSEWGMTGKKSDGDKALRPSVDISRQKGTALTAHIAALAKARKELYALRSGGYTQLHVSGSVFAFMRRKGDEIAVVAVNSGDQDAVVDLKVQGAGQTEFYDILDNNKRYTLADGSLRLTVKKCFGSILTDKRKF